MQFSRKALVFHTDSLASPLGERYYKDCFPYRLDVSEAYSVPEAVKHICALPVDLLIVIPALNGNLQLLKRQIHVLRSFSGLGTEVFCLCSSNQYRQYASNLWGTICINATDREYFLDGTMRGASHRNLGTMPRNQSILNPYALCGMMWAYNSAMQPLNYHLLSGLTRSCQENLRKLHQVKVRKHLRPKKNTLK